MQTLFVSHVVPFGMGTLSSQTREPLVHRTTPVTQAPPGLVVQGVPWSHSKHDPIAVQILPAPHGAPVGLGVLESTHPAVAPHVVRPSRHGLGLVVHGRSASQATHSPRRQSESFLHAIPSVAAGPSMHEVSPPSHRVSPNRHGF